MFASLFNESMYSWKLGTEWTQKNPKSTFSDVIMAFLGAKSVNVNCLSVNPSAGVFVDILQVVVTVARRCGCLTGC